MAQSISEIYSVIVNEVKNQTVTQEQLSEELKAYPKAVDRQRQLLAGLTSNSKVAIWRLWAFVMAVICWIQQVLWDKAKEELEGIAGKSLVDADQYFIDKIKLFEYPGTPVVDPITYQIVFYQSDPSKRIIKSAAITTDSLGVSVVKVGKEDEDGNPLKLNGEERTALEEYAHMIQPVGSNVRIISIDPDLIRLTITVFIDPLLIPIDDEGYPNFKNKVDVALKSALKKTSVTGRISKQRIEDSIQALTGYKNLVLDTLQGKSYSSTSYSNFRNGEYDTVAGYAIAAWDVNADITVLPYNQ